MLEAAQETTTRGQLPSRANKRLYVFVVLVNHERKNSSAKTGNDDGAANHSSHNMRAQTNNHYAYHSNCTMRISLCFHSKEYLTPTFIHSEGGAIHSFIHSFMENNQKNRHSFIGKEVFSPANDQPICFYTKNSSWHYWPTNSRPHKCNPKFTTAHSTPNIRPASLFHSRKTFGFGRHPAEQGFSQSLAAKLLLYWRSRAPGNMPTIRSCVSSRC